MNSRTLSRLLQPLYRRIRLLLRRGVLTGSDSAAKMQVAQVQVTPELTLEMEHFEPYGFTSNAQNGAEPLVGNIEGKSHPVVFVIADRRFRVQGLDKGEVALYDDKGNVIKLGANELSIDAVQHLAVTAPTCNITSDTTHDGDLTINGSLTVNGDTGISGSLTVGGLITGQAGLAVSGGGGASITGGDLTADGISLKGHVHGGVTTGTDTTGAAQ